MGGVFWDWSFAVSILPALLLALRITVVATFGGFLLALASGMVLTLLGRIRWSPAAFAVRWGVQFIRNTPLLVQLYFIFYVFPQFGLTLNPLAAGIIGLGIHYSTYLSEVFRSGIDSVPEGQWEASKALNFTSLQTWSRIILPQGLRPVLPVVGNYLITMFKETPLLSAITLVEIMQTAKMIGASSFRYLESFTLVGIIFLILSYSSSRLIRHLEVKAKEKYS